MLWLDGSNMVVLLMIVRTYLVPWATNDGGEDSPGGVITGETGLAHAGAIVNDQSGCVLVTHLVFKKFVRLMSEELWDTGRFIDLLFQGRHTPDIP